jgi:hypothetical protein
MKTKCYLLFILLPLLLLNCTKEETHKLVTVGGYAVDVATGDTLADVKIRLRRKDKISGGMGNQLRAYETLLDSTTTDANGYFSFTHKMDINKSYAFEPIKNNYWWNPHMQLTSVHTESGTNNFTQLTPLTYLKVNIKNVLLSINYSDSIYYKGPADRSCINADNFWLPSGYTHRFGLNGIEVDTTFFVTLLYYELPLQYWDVTKNGTTIRNAAYIGCNPLDTCFFEIKY